MCFSINLTLKNKVGVNVLYVRAYIHMHIHLCLREGEKKNVFKYLLFVE